MPSWPAQPKYISHSTTRVDAVPKVTGTARYSSDIQASGWLYGMILRSKWPAAKILSVNLDKALQVPGIKAAVTARDGEFTVRFYGEEIAAVAGTSKQACLDALRAIEVKAEPRQAFAVNEDEARRRRCARGLGGHAECCAGALARTRQCGQSVRRMRRRHRRLLHDTRADSSSDGDARQHGFLDGRRRDGVGFHSGHFQRARRSRRCASNWSTARCGSSPISWAAASAQNLAPARKACWRRGSRARRKRRSG